MFRRLNPNISYKLDQIDPSLDITRNEGERRLVPLRALLRCAARKLEIPLVDPDSADSLGAALSLKKTPEDGANVLETFMSSSAFKKAKACLVHSTNKIVTIEEADELDEAQRAKCVAILHTTELAMPLSDADDNEPSVIVTVPKDVCGGSKDGKILVARNGSHTITISIYSTSGTRKNLKAHGLPTVLVDKLFAKFDDLLPSTLGVPRRRNDLPDYLKIALAEFLEKRMRLQVLCTASAPAPSSRPVCLDKSYVRNVDLTKKNLLSVGATLHPSSSSCICGAHGMRFPTWKGGIEIKVETCGRPLQRDGNHVRCPCHDRALDDRGNSRFNIEGMCTEGTCVSVSCWHRNKSVSKRGAFVDSLQMTDADRLELSTILVNMAEFTTFSVDMFDEAGWAVDRGGLVRLTDRLSEKLRSSMEAVYMKQLVDRDPEVDNPKELLRRDMVCVDLLRSGGVFRHIHKKGAQRGKPYIQRVKRSESTIPLKAHETVIADTHAHLFRKHP